MTVEQERAQRIATIALMAATLEAGDRAAGNPTSLDDAHFIQRTARIAQTLYRAVEALESQPENGT